MKKAVDYEGIAARMACDLIGEIFLDMAAALSRFDPSGTVKLITDQERHVISRLKDFASATGGMAGTADVQVMAASIIREITQEAKNRIIDAAERH